MDSRYGLPGALSIFFQDPHGGWDGSEEAQILDVLDLDNKGAESALGLTWLITTGSKRGKNERKLDSHQRMIV